jgi:hypothetical protein
VIFSIEEGYSWGTPAARVAAHLLGGKLEGTHGGLDRHSTLGFFLTNDPARESGGAVRADRVLADWAGLSAPRIHEAEQLLGHFLRESPCCGGGAAGSPAGDGTHHEDGVTVSRSER